MKRMQEKYVRVRCAHYDGDSCGWIGVRRERVGDDPFKKRCPRCGCTVQYIDTVWRAMHRRPQRLFVEGT